MTRIGVPKEIKPDEHRVALTPSGALELNNRGHRVLVEQGAGAGSGYLDADYVAAGAEICPAQEVWEGSQLVLKVKEPIASEYVWFREDLALFTFLHLAADRPLTDALIASGIRAFAYETVEDDRGRLPLLAPMSEVAGRLAPQAGAYFLESTHGGCGLLLAGVAGVQPGRVVVIGGGTVGYNAAVIALGLGGEVTILDSSVARLRELESVLTGRVKLLMSNALQIEESVAEADLVIGAVLVPGAEAPKLLSAEVVAGMKPGSVICDVAIDQGGCVATSRPTSHGSPVFIAFGVTHYCVSNMPGAVPITSTRALTNATLSYVQALAASDLETAMSRDPGLARGANVMDGTVVHQAVAAAHGLDWRPWDEAVGSRSAL
jgi:alanine dehydrogenase